MTEEVRKETERNTHLIDKVTLDGRIDELGDEFLFEVLFVVRRKRI